MTRPQLNTSIDTVFDDNRADDSLTPLMAGSELKKVADYVDQEVAGVNPIKTASQITLSLTPQVLPYLINSCSFQGGIAYLPNPTQIGQMIYAIAVSNSIQIRANVGNTNKMFITFNTFVPNVIVNQYQMYRFTYIGFGSGTGQSVGLIDGYWKAEMI
jgi:hypothetical protein